MSIFFSQRERPEKGHFDPTGMGRLGPLSPPKSKEYKTIATLLDDCEKWLNAGDIELERNTWQMIIDKATAYLNERK